MIIFLPDKIWKNKRGFKFGKLVDYLAVGWHTGQDFFTNPIGSTPVYAPVDGVLTTFQFSKSAGWWGYFDFDYKGEDFSLKILHMHKEMKGGKYKEGDILGHCGATGLSVTSKYGVSYIGPSNKEQKSDKAVGHLHVELHKGEFKHDTNRDKTLAKQRIVDPISIFEKWIKEQKLEKPLEKNQITFYKEEGKSSVFIKGADGIYYPLISGKHFKKLFGEWSDNNIVEVKQISNKSESYFGLFKSDSSGQYNVV